MVLRNRATQFVVVAYAVMVVAIIVANSQKFIYLSVGCWPVYGDAIINYGQMAMYMLLPVLSIVVAISRRWVKSDNGMVKNVIGYAGGFSAGFLITLLTATAIVAFIGPSFAHRFGYIECTHSRVWLSAPDVLI